MSPLWRDEVGIFLAPTKVVLVRLARGVRPQPVASVQRTVSSNHPSTWDAALASLCEVLAGEEWQAANARVVVADAWVRYAVVPWAAALTGAAERRAHAQHVMDQLFGDRVCGWRLALGEQAAGLPGIACAVAAELLEGLMAAAAAARLRVLSLQPQLIAAYNHWRRTLPDEPGWFVSVDAGTLAAMQLTRGGWSQVRSVRIGDDWSVELRRLRTFGRLAAGSDDGSRVYVDAPAFASTSESAADDNLRLLRDAVAGQGTLGHLMSARVASQ